jgi:hypothetical protein
VNSLIRKLLKAVGFKWLTGQIRAAAEGRLGPKWKAAYWKTVGWKRYTSFLLGVLGTVLTGLGYTEAGAMLLTVGTVGVSLGFVDTKWREDSVPDWVEQSKVWRFFADNAPVLAALMFIAYWWFSGTACTLGVWCARVELVLTAIGYAFVHVGLLDTAWKTEPPQLLKPEDSYASQPPSS